MQRLLVLGAMLSLTMPIWVYINCMGCDCMAHFDQATDWASSIQPCFLGGSILDLTAIFLSECCLTLPPHFFCFVLSDYFDQIRCKLLQMFTVNDLQCSITALCQTLPGNALEH